MKYLKSVFRVLAKINKQLTIEVTIPVRFLIPTVLIIMALTGRIGATIATFIAAFLIVILMLPDDH